MTTQTCTARNISAADTQEGRRKIWQACSRFIDTADTHIPQGHPQRRQVDHAWELAAEMDTLFMFRRIVTEQEVQDLLAAVADIEQALDSNTLQQIRDHMVMEDGI